LSDSHINVKFVLQNERSRLKQFHDTAVYCKNSMKHANRLRVQNAGLYVGVGGTCNYHWTLNGYMQLQLIVILVQQMFSKKNAM
jgi:hypothetical protein